MKKLAVYVAVLSILIMGTVFGFTSCAKKLDVEKMLEYQAQASQYAVSLEAGEYAYSINASFAPVSGEYPFRDGKALISGGLLDGVLFEMENGSLTMNSGGFECPLSEKDSPAMYALFAAFAVEPGEFVGVTDNKDGRTLEARFGGKYKYTLTLDKEVYQPKKISVQTDNNTYNIKFPDSENSENS